MIDLDSIQKRIDAGVLFAPDVNVLVAESPAVAFDVLKRVNSGLATVADARTLFSAVEVSYKTKYGRPTSADRLAADAAAAAKAQADADAKRAQDAANAAAAEAMAEQEQFFIASQIADEQAQAVAQEAAKDRYLHDQALAEQLLSEKQKKQKDLQDQLGN